MIRSTTSNMLSAAIIAVELDVIVDAITIAFFIFTRF